MKARPFLALSLLLLYPGVLKAQTSEPLIEPVIPAETTAPALPPSSDAAPDPENAADIPIPVPGVPDAPPPSPAQEVPAPAPTPAVANPFPPLEQQQKQMEDSADGYIIKDAALNDIFAFLAKSAGRQYFHNAKISGPEYLVTGHLNDGNPLQQMEELAFMYGLSLHIKGSTIYALTQAQLSQLPSQEFHYQLRYLRPTDILQIKELIKPVLSPGSGIVNFEPKTNTIIIIDTAAKIQQARNLLHGIDRAKGQIIVETKIFRVNSSAAERTGVDWSSSLGANGTTLEIARSLNSVFGFESLFTDPSGIPATIGTTGGTSLSTLETSNPSNNLVLSPVQLNGVLRALAEGKLATQISNPTLITEDNEAATISIIDRIPIITTTSTQSTSGGNPTVTEEVRYKIDSGDKAITEDPENHREIGISLGVTPTLLPDGTVRMKMRPRSAQVAEYIIGQTGNRYPRVTESMIETLARVPDGYSLVVGGFYGEVKNDNKNKVPLLGDLPVINFFFKSKEAVKERTSLVFIVTPKSYNPAHRGANRQASSRVRSNTTLECDTLWADPYNPGPAHEPNLRRTLRGMQPKEAPLYSAEGTTVSNTPSPEPTYTAPSTETPRTIRRNKVYNPVRDR
ncbi:MAG: hypothetical protein QM627_07260 [Luteolibacter sp.]